MAKKTGGGASKESGSTKKEEASKKDEAKTAEAKAAEEQPKPEPEEGNDAEKNFKPETVSTGQDGIEAVKDVEAKPESEYKHETLEVGDGGSSEYIPAPPDFIDNTPEGVKGVKPDENYILISDKEKEEIIAEAKKIAQEKARKKAREDFMRDALAKAEAEENAKQGLIVDEPMVRHRVNLSAASAYHLINGKQYFHGRVYEVPKSLADDMRRTEYCGHVQEDIRKGNNRNEYGLVERDGFNYGPVAQGGGVQRPGGVIRA